MRNGYVDTESSKVYDPSVLSPLKSFYITNNVELIYEKAMRDVAEARLIQQHIFGSVFTDYWGSAAMLINIALLF